MQIWREKTDTPWYVIGCEECSWQVLVISEDHRAALSAEHETTAHPESRVYRNALNLRHPERVRVRESPEAKALRRAEASVGYFDLPISTAAGAERRKRLVERYRKQLVEQERRCQDCGASIAGTGWARVRCDPCGAAHKLKWKRDHRAAVVRQPRECSICGDPLPPAAHPARKAHEECRAA